MEFSFSKGARGFLVKQIQQAAGVPPDGIFGDVTQSAIAQIQRQAHLSPTGRVDAATLHALGVPLPDDFLLCMNLVNVMEGTGFGDCNETDIDGAGLTWGIAGFTTRHGEVQKLLAAYLAHRPTALGQWLPPFIERKVWRMLKQPGATTADWKALFFTAEGRVYPAWQRALHGCGSDPLMQTLQMQMARDRFWQLACNTALKYGFASLQARAFFLDVAVQNGGWKEKHHVLAERTVQWHSPNEPVRLQAAARVVAACAIPRWQADVKARKLAIAESAGRVHGLAIDLTCYALTAAPTFARTPSSA